MDWMQVLTIAALFLYASTQARTDFLHLDRKLEDNRREILQIVKAIEDENKVFHDKVLKTLEKGH